MKNKKSLFLICIFVLFSIFTFSVSAADITIYVRDSSNNNSLINGATIYLLNSSGKSNSTTNSSGGVKFTGAGTGEWGAFAYASGYGIVNLDKITVTASSGNIEKTIYLKPNSAYPRSYFGKPFTSYTAPAISQNQNFGWRHNGGLELHKGMDIKKDEGTSIYAVSSGSYDSKGDLPGSRGFYVKLKTIANNSTYYITYQHMKEATSLTSTSTITKGTTVVGKVGHTGSVYSSTGNGDHLHIEISTSQSFGSNEIDPNCFFG